MAELALLASVLQVADVGIRLSVTLYTFGQTVASADDSILFISKDISHTCSILKTLGQSLEKDREAHLYSQSATNSAEAIVRECLEIFDEMDKALSKKIKRMGLDGSSSRVAAAALERLKWPFLKPKMMLLWSNLGKLKSSLQLLLDVFIYARLLVERTGESSIVNDQRSMIEHLLRTTAEQSRKYESLKAAVDRNENVDIAGNATGGCIPATGVLEAANMSIEMPNKSRTKRPLGAEETDPTSTRLDSYCTLMEHLMTEIEAEEYEIGHDMRCRIKDDVIHTHKRETMLLRAVHGHTELKEKMRERSSRLAETAKQIAGGEQSQTEHMGESFSGAKPGPCEDKGPLSLGPNLSHSYQRGETLEHLREFEWPADNVRMNTMDRVRAPTTNPAFDFLFINQEDPCVYWVPMAPMVEKPRATEENGWLTFWRFGASMLAFNRILPLDPLKAHLPFLRSETSMLVTDKSHVVENVASSQDLAALTDSTDTDTFVSARSDIVEIASDSHSLCLVEDGDEALAVFGDQGYDDLAGDGGEKLGVSNLYP